MNHRINRAKIMNKISCRIFKRKKNVCNAVFASLMVLTMAVSNAEAGPDGGNVVAGGATINTDGSVTNINQDTQNAIINWQGFSIGVNEAVNFMNGSGATLNRVVGQSVSEILGSLNATGSVYVINENGVTVGPDGQVSVGGSFVGSTRDVSNVDFMNGGDLAFSGRSDAAIVNLGTVESGDSVYLIGGSVFNEGVIKAGGDVNLVAADDVVMIVDDNNGTKFQVVSTQDFVKHNSEAVDVNPMALAMNGGGQNNDFSVVNGRIVSNSGSVQAGGTANLIGSDATILRSGSSVSANNANVGGYYQGGANLPASFKFASKNTGVEAGANINATNQAVVWADDSTIFGGNLTAKDAEVSGKTNLTLQGAWYDNVKADSLLLDPSDMNIINGSSTTINSGTYSANTVYNQDVQTYLNNSGDLSLQTSNAGTGNGDINVDANIVWNSNNNLTMRAHRDINLNGVAIDASASAANADYIALAGRDINVNAGTELRSGQQGSVNLNAAMDDPFSGGNAGNWKSGDGVINFNGDSEIQAKNIYARSGKDSSGDRTDFGTNVAINDYGSEFGNTQILGFENVDLNVAGTNEDYISDKTLIINAKNINVDEDYRVTGAFAMNAASFDDNTNDFVDHRGPYNSLSFLNGSGWENNSGTVTFADGTNLDLCCGVTIQSGKDLNGDRVDLTKDKVNFTYNRDYAIYNWFQVNGFDDFETTFEGGTLDVSNYVEIQNGDNLIDFDITSGLDIPTIGKQNGNGDILIVSQRDTTIAPGVTIDSTGDISDNTPAEQAAYSGKVTIVVDEQEPIAILDNLNNNTGFGDGKLVMDSTATINSGGAVALYTSTQPQNSIDGTINGNTFTPGQEFANTGIEQWLTYYQATNGSSGNRPFRVLYKNNPSFGATVSGCEEESGNPACENFISAIDDRKTYSINLSGEGGAQDVGEETLASGSSEDFRQQEIVTFSGTDNVDTHRNTKELFATAFSIPLILVQETLLNRTITGGIQGIAKLIVSPITAVTSRL